MLANMETKTSELAVIILAAGQGTRMKSSLPKVMHPLAGKPLIQHVLDLATTLQPTKTIVVVGPDSDAITASTESCPLPIETVVQEDRNGTGGAVQCAVLSLGDFTGKILVLFADTPLLKTSTLEHLLTDIEKATVAVLGFTPDDPAQYGRLISKDGKTIESIIEFRDADEETRKIGLCNAGVMAINGSKLPALLAQLDNNNAKQEYYLTDIVTIANKQDETCTYIEATEEEVMGINSQQELANAEQALQAQLRNKAMENGVTLIAPDTTFFSSDTEIGSGTIVHPFVTFGPGVNIAENAVIKSFSHLEGACVGANAVVGPYARLRPGAILDENVHIGNFVEVKNSHLANGSKANHLTYIGDATVGENSNIGAGTITCNYDGFNKHQTSIGKNVFIGSNTALIAPVTIGDSAMVGAGSTITNSVPDDSLALSRPEQHISEGKASDIRKRKQSNS